MRSSLDKSKLLRPRRQRLLDSERQPKTRLQDSWLRELQMPPRQQLSKLKKMPSSLNSADLRRKSLTLSMPPKLLPQQPRLLRKNRR